VAETTGRPFFVPRGLLRGPEHDGGGPVLHPAASNCPAWARQALTRTSLRSLVVMSAATSLLTSLVASPGDTSTMVL